MAAFRAFGGAPDVPTFHYRAADWIVDGVEPLFLLDTTFQCNSTAPGVAVVPGLCAITSVSGGAGAIGYGASGFTVTNNHAAIAAGTTSHMETAPFSLVDGTSYIFYVGCPSGTTAAANYMNLTSKLYALYP
jgi:hypothetical protein